MFHQSLKNNLLKAAGSINETDKHKLLSFAQKLSSCRKFVYVPLV